MAIELVTKYLPYVDELFSTESKKEIISNEDFKWDGAVTVKVYKVGTSAMNDYGRRGASDGAAHHCDVLLGQQYRNVRCPLPQRTDR